MISFYKTIDNTVQPVDELVDGCWVSVVSPTASDLGFLADQLGVDPGFVQAAMDEEESARIESDEGQTLVIVDVPSADPQPQDERTIVYSTLPMSIIILENYVITVCLRPLQVIEDIAEGRVRGVATHLKTRFLFTLLLRIANRFLIYLKQIDKLTSYTEMQLHKAMKNAELIQLLGLQKSLVFFSTSLKSNEMTMEKILRGRILKLYEEDEELLEDVLIEIKQAIEMCSIYTGILSSTMDAFGSIISNNLNIVMKVLTSLTVVMAIPTMVSGFYGMNVSGLPFPYFWFPTLVTLILVAVATIILVKKGMF